MPLAPRWLAPAVLLCAGPAAAADAPDVLVRRLGDPAYAVRERAQLDLARTGPAGLAAAEAAAKTSPNPEVRWRAGAAADALRRRAEQVPLLTAKRVALDYAGRPLNEALADLAKRVGLTLKLDPRHPDPARPVTVTSGELPAWEAVELFRRAAGLAEVVAADVLGPVAPAAGTVVNWTVYSGGAPTTPGDHAGLVPAVFAAAKPGAVDLPAERGGAVRVQALPALFPGHRVIRGAGQVLLALDVMPPAGLQWADGARVRLLRAEDDTGRPLAAAYTPAPVPGAVTDDPMVVWAARNRAIFANGQVVFLNDGQQSGAATFRPNPRLVFVPLATEDRAVRRLRVLEGDVLGTVLVPNQPVAVVPDFVDHLNRPVAAADGSTLVVTKVVPGVNGVAVSVRWEGRSDATLTGGRGLGGGQTDPATRLVFRDAAGAKLPAPTQRGSSWQTNWSTNVASVAYELQFPRAAVPASLTLMGTKPVAVEVAFALKDVPVP